MSAPRPTLIIDLDNTLIECGQYYIDVLNDAAALIEKRTGVSVKAAKDLINAVDMAAITGPKGFSRERFPESFALAATVASQLMHRKIDIELKHECYRIADAVFTAEYALYPDVVKTLQQLREDGWQLVLSTKGELDVQNYKIDKNHLRDLFDHIFISLTKTTAEVEQRLLITNADFARSWAIGDSRKDDIGPALALGIKSILIDPGSNTDWQKSFGSTSEPTAHAQRFADVRQLVSADVARAEAA